MTGPLDPLAPVLGRWRTSGSVLDQAGAVTGEITGTDVYTLLPGGRWIAHEIDVRIGGRTVQGHELIGGVHPSGGWHMYAFDEADAPGVMRLIRQEPGLLLLQGDGVRSWLRPGAGPRHMTTRWERDLDGSWLAWMDMRFDRV